MLGFRNVASSELRTLGVPACYQHGWFYTSVLVEVDKYLPWLMARFTARGGVLHRLAKPLDRLDDVHSGT